MASTNWGGHYTYTARTLHQPASIDELRAIVARAARLRVLGSRHSFSDIADAAELVSLDALPANIEVDRDAGTVSCAGAVRYGELAAALERDGLALANL